MTKDVYIGNLDYKTTEEQVRRLCAPFGKVHAVAMIADRNTGRFRGFCFVEMETADAKKAIAGLNGKEVAGRKLRVSAARARKRGRKGSQGKPSRDRRPLHERTQRGGLGAHDFPHSGGGSRQQREEQDGSRGSSDFPHSGGGSRRSH